VGIKLYTNHKDAGFTLIEVMTALFVVFLLLGSMTVIIQNAIGINGKTNLRSDASSLAYKKVQDYINTDFDNIPIGDIGSAYEVEDFGAQAQGEKLRNATAKVFVEPESVVNSTPTTTTTNYAQNINLDTTYVAGSEINSSNAHDATGDWFQISRIRDNNYTNYTYSRYASNPDNLASPSIDLGYATVVDTIRINWYSCTYGANNFRIEAKNSSPSSNSGWTTILSGLNDGGYPCAASQAQDISVSSNTTPYRYWRLYIVDATSTSYNVISELEAFSAATPGDTVEQHGSTASDSPGKLYFSNTNLEMSEAGTRGQQSLGMIFNNLNINKDATITSAILNFTSAEAQSGAVTLRIKAANVDSAIPWAGDYAVDYAVDTDSSDGKTGTLASITWTPPAWSVNENGADTRIDIAPVIQELVNRAGWSKGNKIAISVQYVSGSGKRVALRNVNPSLQLAWTESVTVAGGNYVDVNGDGDADNPTMLRVTAVIEYDGYGDRHRVEYSTFIRKFGIGS
jgi:type II secretory pathway pseudopilin PulG